MKKYTKHLRWRLMAFFVLGTLFVSAQNVATLHHAGTSNIFYGINAFAQALSASSSGDTVYLSGGFFNCPGSIDKGIHLIGAGHYPDSTLATNKTILTSGFTLSASADNYYMEGLQVNGSVYTESSQSVNNITIRRCHVTGSVLIQGDYSNPCDNTLLVQNVIEGSLFGENARFLLFTNNIIQGRILNMNSNVIQNNIMMANEYWGYPYYNYLSMININSCQVNNNIFFNQTETSILSGIGNFVNNNVFMLSFNPTSNFSSGNYNDASASALFVSQSGNLFSYGHDYHLQDSTAYRGNDGLQLGIYGGMDPYKEGAVPSNPHIRSKSIPVKTDANGNLNISIRVSAQEE